MTCYRPLLAYKEDGKVVFEKPFAFAKGFNLPCNQCIGCRLTYSRNWAIRCIHEAQMHKNNCFITLTFNPVSLQGRGKQSVNKRDYQLFMKRLRKKYGNGIRYFHCGEYGEQHKRPHYHALLFGHDFADKTVWSVKKDIKLYVSKELQELWPHGFSTIGDVNFDSAAYVARYIMKKQTGDLAEEHYQYIHQDTGEIEQLYPEYCTMSRKPGIGYDWFQKYKTDIYPNDYVVIRNNLKIKPPKYYDSLLTEEELKQVKQKRQEIEKEVIDKYDENMDRLFVEEECKRIALDRLIRALH